VKETNLAINSC